MADRHPILIAAAQAYVAESTKHAADPVLDELPALLLRDPGFIAAIGGALRWLAANWPYDQSLKWSPGLRGGSTGTPAWDIHTLRSLAGELEALAGPPEQAAP